MPQMASAFGFRTASTAEKQASIASAVARAASARPSTPPQCSSSKRLNHNTSSKPQLHPWPKKRHHGMRRVTEQKNLRSNRPPIDGHRTQYPVRIVHELLNERVHTTNVRDSVRIMLRKKRLAHLTACGNSFK